MTLSFWRKMGGLSTCAYSLFCLWSLWVTIKEFLKSLNLQQWREQKEDCQHTRNFNECFRIWKWMMHLAWWRRAGEITAEESRKRLEWQREPVCQEEPWTWRWPVECRWKGDMGVKTEDSKSVYEMVASQNTHPTHACTPRHSPSVRRNLL